MFHTAETSLFSAIGHVDICYQGRVISYGNYDPSSETLFGMVGDWVSYISVIVTSTLTYVNVRVKKRFLVMG